MIKADKSTESDAKAALLKLKQKEQVSWAANWQFTDHRNGNILAFISSCSSPFCVQEVERRARKQFKGLFDKKPGEIADIVTDDGKEDEIVEGNLKNNNGEAEDPCEDKVVEELLEGAVVAPRKGWLSRMWPAIRRIFVSMGLQIGFVMVSALIFRLFINKRD